MSNDEASGTELEQTKGQRPGCVTAFVVFIAIGIAVSLFLALATDTLSQYHPTAPITTVVCCIMGIVMAIGFWQMRKWVYIVYGLLIALAYVIHPLVIGRFGASVLPGLIVQVIIFAVLLRFRSRMT